jgi:thioredoxin reductase
LRANTEFLEGRIALDPGGGIATDAWLRTEHAGLCAAGAVRASWLGRAAISAGEGTAAAVTVEQYLRDERWR